MDNDNIAAMVNLQNSYPELEMWSQVLRMAIADLEVQAEKRLAVAWFLSLREDEGSFLWICLMLDLEPVRVRDAVLNRPAVELAA
jgi:hypothetical protein